MSSLLKRLFCDFVLHLTPPNSHPTQITPFDHQPRKTNAGNCVERKIKLSGELPADYQHDTNSQPPIPESHMVRRPKSRVTDGTQLEQLHRARSIPGFCTWGGWPERCLQGILHRILRSKQKGLFLLLHTAGLRPTSMFRTRTQLPCQISGHVHIQLFWKPLVRIYRGSPAQSGDDYEEPLRGSQA